MPSILSLQTIFNFSAEHLLSLSERRELSLPNGEGTGEGESYSKMAASHSNNAKVVESENISLPCVWNALNPVPAVAEQLAEALLMSWVFACY